MIVIGIKDAREAAYADAAKSDYASMAQVENARRCPAAIVQLPQMVSSLVVAAN